MIHFLLSEWRLVAVVSVLMLFALVLLFLRFIQPRALYGARHLLQLSEARRLFLRKHSGRDVSSKTFVELLGKDYRHESVDRNLRVVLTRISRIRELFRILNPGRDDLPEGVKLPEVSVCVTELSQIIGSLARRLVAVPEYDYDLVPAHVVLGTVAEKVEKQKDRNFALTTEADVERWFRRHPVSIEQVIEILIAVVFALSLREQASMPRSLGGGKVGEIPLRQPPGDGPEGILRLIEGGENKTVEFKQTLKRNIHTGAADVAIESAIIRTVAAFLNTEGGTLLVGVDDEGVICGYDADLFQSEDQVRRYIGNKIDSQIGRTMAHLVKTTIETVNDLEIVRIECSRASRPAIVKDKHGQEAFFVRFDASTKELAVSEATTYIKERF